MRKRPIILIDGQLIRPSEWAISMDYRPRCTAGTITAPPYLVGSCFEFTVGPGRFGGPIKRVDKEVRPSGRQVLRITSGSGEW